MVNKDYASHRYSELDQINKDNVKNLHLAFTVALGGVNGVGAMPWVAIRARHSLMTALCMSLTGLVPFTASMCAIPQTPGSPG